MSIQQSLNILNDMPAPPHPRPTFHDILYGAIGLSVIYLIILVSYFFYNLSLLNENQKKRKTLHTLNARVLQIKGKYEKAGAHFIGLLPGNIKLNKVGYFEYFLALGLKQEKKSWLTSIRFDDGLEYIEFKGVAETPTAIYAFINNLGETKAYRAETFSIFSVNDQLLPKKEELPARVRRPVPATKINPTDFTITFPEDGLYRFTLKNKEREAEEDKTMKKTTPAKTIKR